MRLISRDAGKVTWLFPLEEVSPIEGLNAAELIEQITLRYNFKRSPSLNSSREEVSKSGIAFGVGEFHLPDVGESTAITEFSIFTDGIVVNALTTDRAEAFATDVVEWLQHAYNFREFTSAPKKLYVSQLVVEFEAPLSRLITSYERIVRLIAENIAESFGDRVPLMDAARIDFEVDRLANSNQSVPRFVIERRVGVPFAKERYFCGAPMTTLGHIEVLQEIEDVLLSLS